MRPIDRVLERLKGVKAQNGYFMALCPAHADRDPSLSVKVVQDGRVLLHCHAGCSFGTVVEAIDLEPKELFADGNGRGEGGLTPLKTVKP